MARFLFVSTPAAALGSGSGGGIELNVINLARQLQHHGHTIHVLAPAGSRLPGIPLSTVNGLPGSLPPIQPRELPIHVSTASVLNHLWELAFQIHRKFDVVVNWSYDWLPLYLTPFFQTPVVHVISQGSLTTPSMPPSSRWWNAFRGRWLSTLMLNLPPFVLPKPPSKPAGIPL